MDFGHRVWKFYSLWMLEEDGMIDIATILKLLDKILDLEKKVEEAIASEKDKGRRKKIAKAFKDRDRDALADLLFND
jgi:hypothetical protein